ncbi:hypothetical protein [Actinomadura logoneensis]|uniref:hypothetical protein n=1 Tax=Actinomadura logoneensis TaxID=2293572 RepID=UPI001314644C|nr:hypothetical protein [Actinomadura logoneensis]
MESNADFTLDQMLQRASASLLKSLETTVDVEQGLAELHRQATEGQAGADEPGQARPR